MFTAKFVGCKNNISSFTRSLSVVPSKGDVVTGDDSINYTVISVMNPHGNQTKTSNAIYVVIKASS
jgi:hypothetical protein